MELPRQMLNTVSLFYKTGPKMFSCFLFKVVEECFMFSFMVSSVVSWFSFLWFASEFLCWGYTVRLNSTENSSPTRKAGTGVWCWQGFYPGQLVT